MQTDTKSTDLLDVVESFVRRFCVLPYVAYLALSLWIIATHLAELFDCFAYLAALSPTKRCGKTRMFEVIELLAYHAWRGTAPSPATLFRMMATNPTLLLDEVEIFNTKNKSESAQTILAILNAGHRRGASIPRCDGPQHGVKLFPVYGPKAFAAIGRLPETLSDRSIIIAMQRRTPQQRVERFLLGRAKAESEPIREAITNFATTSESRIRAEYERLMNADLSFLSDRDAELWIPLFSICSVLAPDRVPELTQAAKQLCAAKAETDADDSPSIKLLRDIATVWPERTECWNSASLIEELKSLDDSPWRDQGLSFHRLAQMLKPFEIKPRGIRIGDKTPKGYRRVDFLTAWARYVPDTVASDPQHPQQTNIHRSSSQSDGSPQKGFVADETNRESTVFTLKVADVAYKNKKPDDNEFVLPCPVHGWHSAWWFRTERDGGEAVCAKCHPAISRTDAPRTAHFISTTTN